MAAPFGRVSDSVALVSVNNTKILLYACSLCMAFWCRLPAGSPKSTPDRRSAGRSRKGLLVFACAWKDCDYQFEDRDSLVKHLTAAQPGCHFADALEGE